MPKNAQRTVPWYRRTAYPRQLWKRIPGLLTAAVLAGALGWSLPARAQGAARGSEEGAARGSDRGAARGAGPSAEKPWRKGVTQAQQQAASRLLKQGNHYHERLQYAQAVVYYRKALAQWNHPAIQFNLADCYINMDQPLLAYHAIRAALRFGKAPLTEGQFKQARNYLKLLRSRLAEITVETRQDGVQITLDGKPFFKGPGKKTRLVIPGEHQIVGSKAKYVTRTRKVSVFSGKKVQVRVKLISLASLAKNRKVIYKRRWAVWKPWVVFAAGLVAAGAVGVPLLFKARTDVTDFDNYIDNNCSEGCTTEQLPPSLQRGRDNAKYWSATSIGLMAAGGATFFAGVVLVILNRAKAVTVEAPPPGQPPAMPPRVQIVPSVGPGSASVSAQLRF